MSLGHGTKMITDGLVAYYDVSNRKSYRGEPTVNLYGGEQDLSSGLWDRINTSYNNTTLKLSITSTGGSYILRNKPLTSGLYYTLSMECKADDAVNIQMAGSTGFSSTYSVFNLSTGEVVGGDAPTSEANIVELEDGWYRVSVTKLAGSTTSGRIAFTPCQGDTSSRLTPGLATAGQGVFVRNVQFEEKDHPTIFVDGTRSQSNCFLNLAKPRSGVGDVLSIATQFEYDNFKFNGTSDSLVIPQPVSGQTYNDLTFSMWVYPESTGWILCPNSNGIDTYLRYSTATEKFTFTYVESADTTARSVGQSGISPNRWYNVTVSINDKTVKLYVNGQLKDQRTDTINIGLLTGQWYLGKRPNNTNHFGGRIGTFKVYDRTLSDREVELDYTGKAPSYPGHSPKYPAKSGYALSQIMPESNSGYYWIQNRKMPGPLEMYVDMEQEGGGYDFYVITNGINPRFVNEPNSGTELGLDLIYPRSKEHWQAMHNFAVTLGGNLNTYFSNMGAVYRTGGIGNYTSYIMRNPDYYGTGAPNWQVPDGGRWWLRDSTYTEPNGDYSAYGFLGSRGFPSNYNGEDMVFNDVYSTNSTYDTGAYRPGTTYLVSTNAKP